MHFRTIITVFTLTLLLSTQLLSQYKVIESFNYPAGSSLDTLLGSAGNGWGGSWDLFDGNTGVMTVADTGLVYDDLNYPVPNVGLQLTGANPAAWGFQRYGRYLDKTWPEYKGDYWISFLIELTDFTDNGWAGLGLWSDTTEGPLFGHEWGNPMYSLGLYNDASHTSYSCHGGPQWIVVRMVMTGDTLADRNYMWVSPDPEAGEPDTNLADARGSRDLRNGFNRIVVHWGGEGVGMQMQMDEIRLGTTWQEVSEPISGNDFLVRESFNYPAGSSIDTLLGGAGNGWGGSWDLFDGNTGVMTVADTGIVYDDLNFPVPNVGLQLTGANPAAWGFQRYGRHLDKTWPDYKGDYWISFLIELTDFTDNGWAGLGLWQDSTEGPLFGHEWGNPMYSLGLYNDASHTPYSCHGGPQWLVVRMIMTGDTLADRNFMWVSPDPTAGEPDTTIADARGSRNVNGFNNIVVHWGGEGVGMQMQMDEIRIGTSWQDVSSEITGVKWNDNETPEKYALSQNYPNPFNPSTKIAYLLKNTGKVRLSVYDLLGREVKVLVDEVQSAGNYEVPFNALGLASGIYLYKLKTNEFMQTKKMLLVK